MRRAAVGWSVAALLAGAILGHPAGRAVEPPASGAPQPTPTPLVERLAPGVTLELVPIPAGSFLMGGREGEYGRGENEGPLHEVAVKAFFLGRYEVTQAQFEAVMGADRNPSHFKGPDLPVERVTWAEAMAFCRRLAERTGKPYALPTEAQWEYAARAGENRGAFHFGDDQALLADHAWYNVNAEGRTHPVGGRAPNPWGLYDLYGNVAEWCLNVLADYPWRDDDGRCDPNAPGVRVLRGGGWADSAWGCRAAYRWGMDPAQRFYTFGFRVALNLP